MNIPKKLRKKISNQLETMDEVLKGKKHLLIIVHNNPDPDAIASAFALSYIAESRTDIKSSIAYGGNISRAENRTMVQKLKIHLKQINRIHFDKYDCIALVDTQPGAGNNSMPARRKCHIVIDHHPQRDDFNSDLTVVSPDLGGTATILVEWLNESDLEIYTNLATALSFAISSETQNLGREAGKRDIQAYLNVFIKSNMKLLSQILYPKLPRSYFKLMTKALYKTHTYKNLICSHIGEVPNAEIVSEIADFILRHERIGWALCTGKLKDQLIISVRSTNPNAQAGKLVKKMVNDPNTVGGHDMIAGGYIPLTKNKKEKVEQLEQKLSQDFACIRGYKNPEWKPLLNSSEKEKVE